MLGNFFRASFFICVIFLFNSYAHIDKTSLSIKGGEKFKTGENVQITWKYAIFHNRIHYIYFSAGAGKPWQKIDSIMEKSGAMNLSYTWTVPQTATESARIRIFQSFVATPGEQTNDYTIVSNTFTILAATTTIPHNTVSHEENSKYQYTSSSLKNRFDLSGRLVKESDVSLTRKIKPMRRTILY